MRDCSQQKTLGIGIGVGIVRVSSYSHSHSLSHSKFATAINWNWKLCFCFRMTKFLFLLWFLGLVFISIPLVFAYSESDEALDLDSAETDKSIATLSETPLWKSIVAHHAFPNKEPTIVVLPNGTIYFFEGNSGKPLWWFSTSSLISSSYEAVPEGDNKEYIYPLDVVVPYPHNELAFDFGGDFMQRKGFKYSNLMKIVEEYIANVPFISKDEITIGAKKFMIKILDAKNGSLIGEFSPSDSHSGEKHNLSEINTTDQVYIIITLYTLNSFEKKSYKLLWNLTVSEIQAALHYREGVIPLSVIHICDDAHVQFVLKNLLLNGDREPLRIGNSDGSSTSVATVGNTDSNFTSLATFEDIKRLQVENKIYGLPIANTAILWLVAVVLVCGSGYILKRQQSVKKLEELKRKKSIVHKKKKSRKLGSYKRSINSENSIDTILSEESVNPIVYSATENDGKGSWFQLGASDDHSANGRAVGKLFISNIEIAKGSNGTVVLEGRCDGRPVAVKRLVQAHHDVAYKEIQHLIASDRHPNIVRWYGVECDSDFVYLSLERCACSLNDLIQICSDSSRPSGFTEEMSIYSSNEYGVQLDSAKEILKDVELWKSNGHPSTQLLKIMREVVCGVAHLHELGIVHRDLKPQNILISKERSLCAKLSDMGISKRLAGDSCSLGHHPTGYGSSGWQAPEQLLHGRQTRSVDLFSLGCVLFFCITGGKHPFGEHLERDINIVKNRMDLFVVEHIPEAVDLITHLLDPIPEMRPNAWNVMNHPLFWNSETRLSFLRDASDRVELEDRENNSDILNALEIAGPIALGGNWDTKMETAFISNIGRYRRYKFDSMRDLLRVIRNKLNHYRELPKEIQEILGPIPDGFNDYFSCRFPRFLIEVYKVIHIYCQGEEWFGKYLNNSST